MKILITIHPIDTKFMRQLGIHHSSQVEHAKVGYVIDALCCAGYHHQITTHVTRYAQQMDQIEMHFKKVD